MAQTLANMGGSLGSGLASQHQKFQAFQAEYAAHAAHFRGAVDAEEATDADSGAPSQAARKSSMRNNMMTTSLVKAMRRECPGG